jgi:hypothetical protein
MLIFAVQDAAEINKKDISVIPSYSKKSREKFASQKENSFKSKIKQPEGEQK